MRHEGWSAAVLLLVLAATPAAAQEPAAEATAAPIATVNLSYVAQRSVAGQRAFGRVAEREAMWIGKLDVERRVLADQQRALSTTLAGPDRLQLERTFQRARVSFERLQQDANEDVLGLERQVASEFQQMVAPHLDSLARERGVTLLLDSEATVILWVSPAVDLSDELVKRIDAPK